MLEEMLSLAVLASLAAAPCNLYAAPSGSDVATGSAQAPLRTVQRLADRLAAGQVGCLADGTYAGAVTITHGPITLRARHARAATVRGQLRINDGANGVTISGLRLDGTNPEARPSPLVNGDDARFERNEVFNRAETCFVLGDKVWGVADRTVIAGNDIHHCGVDGTNQDHGVYVREATATRIEGNVIRDNPDRGVQLFPNADRSVVRGNLIDRNGEGVIFSGDSDDTSDDNLVENNLISNSDLRFNVESYWFNGRIGHGNVARGNCVWGGRRGNVQAPQVGFAARRNLIARPSDCPLRSGVFAQHVTRRR
jgi:nitrous oxidase accessory protein NosD